MVWGAAWHAHDDEDLLSLLSSLWMIASSPTLVGAHVCVAVARGDGQRSSTTRPQAVPWRTGGRDGDGIILHEAKSQYTATLMLCYALASLPWLPWVLPPPP